MATYMTIDYFCVKHEHKTLAGEKFCFVADFVGDSIVFYIYVRNKCY